MGIVARQSIKGTVVTYIGVAVGIITTFFIQTKVLEAEQIGLIEVLLQCAILFSGIAQLGTTSSAMRYYPFFKDEESRDHGFFGWTLLVPLVGFLVFLAVFFLFKDSIVASFSKDSPIFSEYVYFVIPLAFFMLYISVFETNSNLLLRIVVPKIIREVGLRVMVLLTYLLYAFKVISFDGVIISFCVFYGLATLVNIVYLLRLKRVSFKIEKGFVTPKLKRDFIFYTLFIINAALAGNVMPMLSKFFVAAKESFHLAGVFTIATNIAALVEMPYRSLGAISRPHISHAIAHNDIHGADEVCKSVGLHQFLVGAFIFFLIWINIDLIFSILPNGEIYRDGKWVVFILGMSRLVYSTCGIGATVLSYSKFYYFSLIFTVIMTVSSIMLNNYLIPIWGINGAAMANLLSYTLYFILLLGFVKWRVGTSPFSLKQLLVLGIIVVLFGMDWLWSTLLTPVFAQIGSKSIYGLLLDGALKSCLFLALGCVAVYKIRLSQSVNEMIDRVLGKLSKK